MDRYQYIQDFKKLGFGMFCHFGLYSLLGSGEWALTSCNLDKDKYNSLTEKFAVKKDWAKKLVSTAKNSGCKYITLTTRHHDGFSLYDACGLNTFDAPHSLCGRDLVREFVDECNAQGILPIFYHTLLDWHNPDYQANFNKYLDYLVRSIEILCTNYGKIGGLWFDGMWDKKDADWQLDRLYGTIRKLQPTAMIINNTGLDAIGQISHPEIDSVTFERDKPFFVKSEGKPICGEVCDSITDHWGYTKKDISQKSTKELLYTLVDCRKYDCNYLLNVGPMGNGYITAEEVATLKNIGLWIKTNKNFIYNVHSTEITAQNANIVSDGDWYYAIIKNVPMCANLNVARAGDIRPITVDTDKKIVSATWLDNGQKIELTGKHSFNLLPFSYGTSLLCRVARFKLK